MWRAFIALSMLASSSSGALADVIEVGSNGVFQLATDVTDVAPGGSQVVEAPLRAPPTSISKVPLRWRDHVAAASSINAVSPKLIEALVWQESRWNPTAVSPAGALGLTQLMPGTARDLGVDARNPAANLEGGARYLRAQIRSFDGDLLLALAAYNAGPGRVKSVGRVPAISETKRYVASIVRRLITQ